MMRQTLPSSMFRAVFAVALLLPLQVGCLHKRCAIPPEMLEHCRDVPTDSRHKVYVVMLHGFDPIDWNELDTLRNTMRDVGFIRTYYGHWYHAGTSRMRSRRRSKKSLARKWLSSVRA